MRILVRRASASLSDPAVGAKEGAAKEGDKTKEIDDAVLQMAMAMAEEEDGGPRFSGEPEKKESGFDFNIIVQAFWICLIVYSFGSSIIGITQGRIQDRTGGDFTAYDFLDNIFAFREWNLEYSLGFDPVRKLEELKASIGGGAASP